MAEPRLGGIGDELDRSHHHLRGAAGEAEARARAIAVEQSIEVPAEAIDPFVLGDIVGRVVAADRAGDGGPASFAGDRRPPRRLDSAGTIQRRHGDTRPPPSPISSSAM